MKHTSGPWAIRDDDEDGVVSIVGSSQIVLARVRTATVEPGDENARLIAAAPELLEAAYQGFRLAQFLMSFPQFESEARKAFNCTGAAIAKSTGEQ